MLKVRRALKLVIENNTGRLSPKWKEAQTLLDLFIGQFMRKALQNGMNHAALHQTTTNNLYNLNFNFGLCRMLLTHVKRRKISPISTTTGGVSSISRLSYAYVNAITLMVTLSAKL